MLKNQFLLNYDDETLWEFGWKEFNNTLNKMDIKYNVSKLKNSKLEEIKDSVSVEEPLEMRLKYKKNNKWEVENISITMRTPGNDEDLIKGFLFNERIITNINDIESIEHKGDVSGDYELQNIIEAKKELISPLVGKLNQWLQRIH